MDTENTFAKKVQKAMGSAIPDWIPRGKWRGVSYGHILTDMRNNFIDGCYPVKCCIKGNLSEGEIKYHQGASHLNSSQVMCINFFKKFFEKDEKAFVGAWGDCDVAYDDNHGRCGLHGLHSHRPATSQHSSCP